MAGGDIRVTPEQEAQFRGWAKDPAGFFEDVVKIDSRGKPIPFAMRAYQKDCLKRFLSNQIALVLKARQIGLTTVACALALWTLLFNDDRFVLVLSKSDEDSKKFLRRVKFMYKRLPPWVKARGPQLVGRWGDHKAEFSNGSIVFSATSGSDHGRGDTPTDIFLDEIGKMKNPDDAWSSVYPAVEDGGNLWMFGTADGYMDWLHQQWIKFTQPDSEVETIFYGWDVVDGRDEAWAGKQKRILGEARFRREYPSTAEEAFVTSGKGVFSIEVLEAIAPWPAEAFALVRNEVGVLNAVPSEADDKGFGLFLYEHPEPGGNYAVAGDPSEGLVGGDPAVAQVLQWKDGKVKQVAVLRGHLDPEDFADRVQEIAEFYDDARIVIERNNHGFTVLRRLREIRALNVVYDNGKPGLWTSAGTKLDNIVMVRRSLADGSLEIRDQWTITELMGYRELTKPSGATTYAGADHDDHVDSICQGVGYILKRIPKTSTPEEAKASEPPHPFSLDGMMARSSRRTVLI